MTDTKLEPGGFCSGCGNFVAVRLADIHKRRGCTARLDNTFRQWRQQHEGIHVALDATVDSFDRDIDTIIKWQDAADARPPSSSAQPGVTLADDLEWTPEPDLPSAVPTLEPRQPQTEHLA
jgi:hypothetical protein